MTSGIVSKSQTVILVHEFRMISAAAALGGSIVIGNLSEWLQARHRIGVWIHAQALMLFARGNSKA